MRRHHTAVVAITASERSGESLRSETLARARAALAEHGYLILENAIEEPVLDALRAKMTRDSEALLRGARVAPRLFWSASGHRVGHLQQSIPRSKPHVHRQTVCNPSANAILAGVLGEDAFFAFPTYSCNVNCPGSVDQDVHFDPAPPGTYVVNIPLRDVSARDGAIELWPGTHVADVECHPVAASALARRARVSPPVRGETRKGSLLIRDLRLWHRGRANTSEELRHMLAILYYPASAASHPQFWARTPTVFASDTLDDFRESPVRPYVAFREGPIPYLLDGPADELRNAVRHHPWMGKAKRATTRAEELVKRLWLESTVFRA